jgi:hypothetical protein
LQLRRGLSSEWTSSNPVLAQGEMAVELDTHRFKIGDGVTNWVSLPYGGLQGPAGTNSVITVTSPLFVASNKVLAITGTIGYADSSNVNHAGYVLGISSNSATAGTAINISTTGLMTGFTSLGSGIAYLGTGGNIVTTPPTSGFLQQIGIVISSTSILIDIGNPILF